MSKEDKANMVYTTISVSKIDNVDVICTLDVEEEHVTTSKRFFFSLFLVLFIIGF